MTSQEILYFVFTIDTDPDKIDKFIYPSSKTISWRGIEEGIPLIINNLSKFISDNEKIKYTWFIRCDMQLQLLFHNPAYIFEKFRDIWTKRQLAGDEIAWHPHLYDHDFRLINNEKELISNLIKSYSSIPIHKFKVISSRIGRCYSSNVIIKQLDAFGIQVDSSALPGRKRKDMYNSINWEITPYQPYYPSKFDYRIPGKNHYKLLEVPLSMIPTNVSYKSGSLLRYVNLAFKYSMIKNSLKKFIRRNNLLVTVLHPYEIISKNKHALLSNNLENVKRNLDLIFSECKKSQILIKFITLSEIPYLLKKGYINEAKK